MAMIHRTLTFLVLLAAFGSAAHPQAVKAIQATINAGQAAPPISPRIYGQFIEHIAGIINTGIWAEMLEDRKFYHPITSEAPPAPVQQPFGPVRRWTPIGPDDSIVMDPKRPYAGDHAPRVTLHGSERHGFQQAGLAVRKGKRYSGRIVLAGAPDARISVSLVWGTDQRQTLNPGKLRPAYSTFPLKFQAQADSDDARIEITGTGTGTFHVGAVSLMPEDNLQGFRPEIIAALKQLRSGVYRFPGGNFVSAHEWRDAVGDPDKRPPVMDPVWNAVQPNDVGIDEFMTLCRLLEVEPYLTVNAGFGDAWSAAQLVEYANGPATTPMGKWRAANGHPQPYGIKLWGIGNEMFGIWQMGVMPPDQYQIKHNLFARAMRRVDPSITLLASGAMPDHMTGSDLLKMNTGKVVPDYLEPWDWSGGLLTRCLDNLDMLSEHYYAYSYQRFDFEKEDRVPDPDQTLVEWARQPASYVRAKYEHFQEYLARIPALRDKPVPVSISEWAYTGVPANSYKVVLPYAWAFHEMFRHSELFKMATFTFATSLLSTGPTEAVLNPSGLLFKMYRDHFGTIPVAVTGNSPQPPALYPGRGMYPKVNPGSDTYPLDVAAALSADRKTLSVAVINLTDSEQPLALDFKGLELTGKGKLRRMAPKSLDAEIVVGKKPGVEIEEHAVAAVPERTAVAPFSVSIYELAVE